MRQRDFILSALTAITALLALLAVTTDVRAGIYKLVDEDGRVTYTNTPARGAQKLEFGAPEAFGSRAAVKAVVTTPPTSMGNFPKVSAIQQKRRDDQRRQILENELAEETKRLLEMQRALDDAKRSLQVQADSTMAGSLSDDERITQLRKQVASHERNVMALRTELEKL